MADENQQGTAVQKAEGRDLTQSEIIRQGANLPAEQWSEARIAAALKLLPEGFQTPQYGIAYLARCQRAGLDPFMGELHAWKDPRSGELVFHTDIDGWVNIAKNDPDILGIEAGLVHEDDHFKWTRHEDGRVTVNHSGGMGSEVKGAYCVVHMKDGKDHIELRQLEDYQHLARKDNWQNHPKDMILIRVYEAAVGKKSTKATGIHAQASFQMGDQGRVMGAVERQAASEATDAKEDELMGKLQEQQGEDVTPPPPQESEPEPDSPGEEEASEPSTPESSDDTATPEPTPEPSEGSSDEEGDEDVAVEAPQPDDEPLDFRKHTDGLPEGYGIIEAVYPDDSTFMPCTLDEEGLPDTQLLEEGTCDSREAAERIIQANVDRPQPEEGSSPQEPDAVEEGGMDDTPRKPCPVCGEYLKPSQMGGHKSGHSKKGEKLPSEEYRIHKWEGEDGEPEYTLSHEGVEIEEGIPNYLQALALADKHAREDEEGEKPGPPDPSPGQETDESAADETDRWNDAFARCHRMMGQYDLPQEALVEAVQEVNPQAVKDGRPQLSQLASKELEEVGDKLQAKGRS